MVETIEEIQLPIIDESKNILFLKGVKPGQEFYFINDESEEICTKLYDLYYETEDGRTVKGQPMDKVVLF